MNELLELKGSFNHKKNENKNRPIPKMQGEALSVSHLKKLEADIAKQRTFWQTHPVIGGALISVHYYRIIPKSCRITQLLGKTNLNDAADSIRGVKFSLKGGKTHHVFTHFLSDADLERAQDDLRRTRNALTDLRIEVVTKEIFEQILKGAIKLPKQGIPKTKLCNIVKDASVVEEIKLDATNSLSEERQIFTLYDTNCPVQELLRKIGIDISYEQILSKDSHTVLLYPNEIERLISHAPYLIAMRVNDFNAIEPNDIEGVDESLVNFGHPTDEPTIGVIDQIFKGPTRFSEWIEDCPMVDASLVQSEEIPTHGTEVSSIVVAGPIINKRKNIDDGCGQFRVKHFGVCAGKRFSSFDVMKRIQEAVSQNPQIKVWNLCLGSSLEVSENYISPEAALLDKLQNEYDITFVVAGTNKDSNDKNIKRIGAPADSLNSIVVNAVDNRNQPASYSRVGPVLSFFIKPDLATFGGDRSGGILVCNHNGEGEQVGTSFAAPWITRKLAYLIYKMNLPREVAKALLIDSAQGWNTKTQHDALGRGIVPMNISEVLNCPDDEIRFFLTGTAEDYMTYSYNLPVPIIHSKQPFYAKATLCYFPACSILQGVDYTSTELDIHFGRVDEKKKDGIYDIKRNLQGEGGLHALYEESARQDFRKWDNVKVVSDELKTRKSPRKILNEKGLWGIKILLKNRLPKNKRGLPFGLVVRLKEMSSINRIDEFIQKCNIRGWLVNKVSVENEIAVYNQSQEDIHWD